MTDLSARRKGRTVELTTHNYRPVVPTTVVPYMADADDRGFGYREYDQVDVAIPSGDSLYEYPLVLAFQSPEAADELARLATEAGRLLRLPCEGSDAETSGSAVEGDNHEEDL